MNSRSQMNCVLHELEEETHMCCECYDLKHIILHNRKCMSCDEHICSHCVNYMECPDAELCNNCYFTDVIIHLTGELANKELYEEDVEDLFDLYYDLWWEEKEQIIENLMEVLEDKKWVSSHSMGYMFRVKK